MLFTLMWCSRNPLNNLGVIPGKLAIARATRNQKLLDTRFRGYDGGSALAGLLCELFESAG